MVTAKEKARKALRWIGHRFEAIIGILLLITFIGMFSSIFGAILGLVGYTLPIVIPVGIIAFAKWVSDLGWMQILSVIPKILLSSERNPNHSARQTADWSRDPTMASQQGRDHLTQNILQGGKSREDLIEEKILTPILNDVENHLTHFEKGFATTFDTLVFDKVRDEKYLYLKTKERPEIEAYYTLVKRNNENYHAFIKKAKTVFKLVIRPTLEGKDSLVELDRYVAAIGPAIDRLCDNWSDKLIRALETNTEEATAKIIKRLDEGLLEKLLSTKISEHELFEKIKKIATQGLSALAKEKETKELLEKRKEVASEAKKLKTLLEKSLTS